MLKSTCTPPIVDERISDREESAVATVRASCPECGDVELTTREVRVIVCSTTNQGSYAFQCPRCRLAVSKPTEPHVVDVLVASGATLAFSSMPAELNEFHSGPPISYDDLLAFHFMLQGRDCLAELRELAPQLQSTGAAESR
ncbi:MAG: hypothetical protein ABIS21_00480 [Acidimicrobiales bacterium]